MFKCRRKSLNACDENMLLIYSNVDTITNKMNELTSLVGKKRSKQFLPYRSFPKNSA